MKKLQKPSTTRNPSTAIGLLAIGLAALLGVSACGSDKKSSSAQKTDTSEQSSTVGSASGGVSVPDVSVPDVSLPDGVTLPPGVSIPNFSKDCLAFSQLFAQALTGTATDLGSSDEAIAALKAKVPADLRADFDKVTTAFAKLVDLSSKNKNNPSAIYSDPAIVALFSDPGFTAAAQRVTTWLSTECGTAG